MEFKKRSAEETEALREKNIWLKRKIEVKTTTGKEKDKEVVDNVFSVHWTTHTFLVCKDEVESRILPLSITYHSLVVGEKHHHPLIDNIINTLLPMQWKTLTLDRYDDFLSSGRP